MIQKLLKLWFAIFLVIGVGSLCMTPGQIEKDRSFVDTKLKPVVHYVDSFRKANNRVPTEPEFDSAKKIIPDIWGADLLPGKEDGLRDGAFPANIDWSKEYAIMVWRGDWAEYYYSWNKRYETNNWSWLDAFAMLAFSTIIGFIPLLISKVIKNLIRKKNN